MAIINLFPNLALRSVPTEAVRFRAAARQVVLELDDDEGLRLRFVFGGVMGIRLTPAPLSYDVPCLIDDRVVRSVLEDTASAWVQQLHSAQRRQQDVVSSDVRHFLVPVEDGVWEFLARFCQRKGPCRRSK